MQTWIYILAMAAITFSVRYLFFIRSLPLSIGPELQRLLGFSAPAVLAALATPIVFFPEQQWHLGPDNPYLIGGVCAALLAALRLGTLWVILLSTACFVGLRLL
jgi:branched-subunit amino acid transport protein